MKTSVIVGAIAAFIAAPVTAQSAQERLDARYDRALAAGYKGLMLCSAIANAERVGGERTPQSVHEWELTGIYPALDPIIRDLPYEIVRAEEGHIRHVLVEWADDMPPRIARHDYDHGCVTLPIGWDAATLLPELDAPVVTQEPEREEERFSFTIEAQKSDGWTKPQPTALDTVLDAAMSGGYGEGSRTTVVMIERREGTGGLVGAARLAPGFSEKTPQRTWSVAKSIAATLVGVAKHNGEACIGDQLLTKATPAAGDPRNAVSVDHLLRMASGRYSDTPGNRTDPLYWGGTTIDERAANWPLVHKPGTVYRYANNDTLMAVEAIACSFDAHPPSEFFAKLGMNATIAETDWQGNYVLSSQVWSTADDLAKLGLLYLNNGVWNGERILPEGWRDYVSTPSGPQPEGTQWGYGAGWWTFRRPEGNAFEGIPDDAFAARGNRGQYVVVVPSRNVVIVRRGEDVVGTRFDIAAFTRDVLAALD
ncbi:MAG: serine hydrolase [Erythrobacter sp.]|uniref:serine hydrolase domain-containing protein n=1 Tax=Erythrobacter sp. TaxID=1042 RepID=UPI0026233414|nr:serine hydrolase [Erythrobacter sp.]MDJ0978069.1 serine hydrolase [Erythrobacter sp.]